MCLLSTRETTPRRFPGTPLGEAGMLGSSVIKTLFEFAEYEMRYGSAASRIQLEVTHLLEPFVLRIPECCWERH